MSVTHQPSEDPLRDLPRDIYYQVIHDLRAGLPAADTPEALDHRIRSAIADVASMLPANAEEASLATRCVAAHAQAMDSLRLARLRPDDVSHVLRCSAQSAAMMRTANGARALLLRVQAVRHKREADPATRDRAAWIEHCAAGLMLGTLKEVPQAAVPAPPEPAPEPAPTSPDRFGVLSEAEQYAVLHPRRAALIRSLGRLPDNCTFGPPEPELVDAIVTGTSPVLLALDQQGHLVSA